MIQVNASNPDIPNCIFRTSGEKCGSSKPPQQDDQAEFECLQKYNDQPLFHEVIGIGGKIPNQNGTRTTKGRPKSAARIATEKNAFLFRPVKCVNPDIQDCEYRTDVGKCGSKKLYGKPFEVGDKKYYFICQIEGDKIFDEILDQYDKEIQLKLDFLEKQRKKVQECANKK